MDKLAEFNPWYNKAKQFISHLIFKKRLPSCRESDEYSEWIKLNEENTPVSSSHTQSGSVYFPKISVIMPVWNTDEKWLRQAVQSVRDQKYENWELCIADGNSTHPGIQKILRSYSARDQRIKCIFLPENKGIAGNTNEALRLATGDFVCFLDHDDMLSKNCLFEVVGVFNRDPSYDIVYSDNDMIDTSDCRNSPFFKFDFSLPALLSTNYPFHFFLCRRSLILLLGGLRHGFDGAQDYDLILRLVEHTSQEKIAHIDKILYHWRMVPTSSASGADAKPYAYKAGKRALEEYLERNQIIGEVHELDPGSYRVKKSIQSPSKVLVVILSDNTTASTVFIEFLQNLLSNRTFSIDTLFIPAIYSGYFTGLKIHIYSDITSELLNKVEAENNSRIIFTDDKISSFSPHNLHVDWIESLIEHFDYFHTGIVGTGSLTFTNIICNVQRTCGPVFCVDSAIFISFCADHHQISGYDDFQIEISDYAMAKGFDNLYTPFCIGNAINYSRISDYYSNIEGKFFTKNMSFYLPDYLKVHTGAD